MKILVVDDEKDIKPYLNNVSEKKLEKKSWS